MTPHKDTQNLNNHRRMLLKLAFLGSATFVLSKVLGPVLNILPAHSSTNFRVVDRDSKLYVYDKDGNELLVVEKDSDAAGEQA